MGMHNLTFFEYYETRRTNSDGEFDQGGAGKDTVQSLF